MTWIPGYSGILGNEIADEQATIAINNNATPLIKKMSYDDLKNKLMKQSKLNGRDYGTIKSPN